MKKRYSIPSIYGAEIIPKSPPILDFPLLFHGEQFRIGTAQRSG